MERTSRKGDNGRSGRDDINSRKVDCKVREQELLLLEKNEIEIGRQCELLDKISKQMIDEGNGMFFLKDKYLDMFHSEEDYHEALTEEELNTIESLIPKSAEKTKFIQYGLNPSLRKMLTFTLIMVIIASLVEPTDAKCGTECKQKKCERAGKEWRSLSGIAYTKECYPKSKPHQGSKGWPRQ